MGLRGGRRQVTGLERTGGRTRDSETGTIKGLRSKDLRSRPCKVVPAGVEMSKGGTCHPVPGGLLG